MKIKKAKAKDPNAAKPLFSASVFASKSLMPAHEYYLYLAKRAIDCGLLTNKEFKLWSARFRTTGLSPERSCLAFDTIIKKLWQQRDSDNYFLQNNRQANEGNSLSSLLLNAHGPNNNTDK